jgi:hypothetical protein
VPAFICQRKALSGPLAKSKDKKKHGGLDDMSKNANSSRTTFLHALHMAFSVKFIINQIS